MIGKAMIKRWAPIWLRSLSRPPRRMLQTGRAFVGSLLRNPDEELGRAALEHLRSSFTGPLRRAEGAGALRLVILNHFYDQDIDAFARCATDCELWILQHSDVAGIRPFFQPEPELHTDYRGAHVQKRVRAARRYFGREAVAHIRAIARPDAVVAPSDSFYWFRPLMEEFNAQGVPVIVQDKEGTLTPGPLTEEHVAQLVRSYPPMAQRFLFWGPVHREVWERAGLSPPLVRVVGMPRSDFFFHPQRHARPESLGLPAGKKLVTFFTYEGNVYLTSDSKGRPIGKPWLGMRQSTHQALIALARQRPDVHGVVKCHPQSQEIDEIRAELAEAPANLTVMLGASTASNLIVNSAVVIGFQTTAMIETMLTSTPIIYTGWAEEHDRYLDWLIPLPQSGACFLPGSGEELFDLTSRLLDGRTTVPESMLRSRQAFAARYFHDARGVTTERVLQAIAEEVAQWRRTQAARVA
jgi:hypothetical protein